MKKFVLIFVSLQKPDVTTQQKLGSEWMATLKKGTVDTCAPFEPGKMVSKNSIVDDKTDFGGFMIINADSLDTALKIAQTSPHVSLGGKIIVKPLPNF